MKYKILIIVLIISLGIISMVIFKLRRNLPYYFDFVKIKNGIAIIQHEVWNQRKLGVIVLKDGQEIGKGIIDPETHSCVIENIKNKNDYAEIVIKRQDIVGKLRYRPLKKQINLDQKAQTYILLAGASIGNEWKLSNFNLRTGESEFVFGNRIKYDFDKQELLDPMIQYKYKPDAVIIKECSAYFPRDIQDSSKQLKKWAEFLEENKIVPILATTTPVKDASEHKERQKSIDNWNKFIREYGEKKEYPVIDLAKALQQNDLNTHLKNIYSKEDGIHLTSNAYAEALDPTLKRFLATSFRNR